MNYTLPIKQYQLKIDSLLFLALYRSTLQAIRFDSGAAASVCVRSHDLFL